MCDLCSYSKHRTWTLRVLGTATSKPSFFLPIFFADRPSFWILHHRHFAAICCAPPLPLVVVMAKERMAADRGQLLVAWSQAAILLSIKLGM